MRNKTALLTFDLEEFVTPKEKGIVVNEEELFNIGICGLKQITRLIKSNPIKSTFFTTKKFAEKKEAKPLLKHLVAEGHEIALHGNDHMDIYSQMKEEELLNLLFCAKEFIENEFSCEIIGFRSPRLQKVPMNILEKLKLTYDASFHPTFVPGKYNNFCESRTIISTGNITTIPISVTPILRLPFSWFWFRNLGLAYTKMCTTLNFLDSDFVHLYFHPWDFYNFKEDGFNWKINHLFTRNTHKAIFMLDNYIDWLKNKNIKFTTIKEYLHLRTKTK